MRAGFCENLRPRPKSLGDSKRVRTMNDELQIIDLEPGDGKAAVKGALITTQYRGWLEDGTNSILPTAGANLSSA